MFGYISIIKAEMKFKDYDMYHSYYCGLCKCLKECYGIRGQMTLSFDMTFPGSSPSITTLIVSGTLIHIVPVPRILAISV